MFAIERRWPLFLTTIAVLSTCLLCTCAEITCNIGCEEDRGDCEDDPAKYDLFGRCATTRDPTFLAACYEQICDAVYGECADRCNLAPEPPP